MTDPIYAVGDIHGQREMLEHALERIEADGGPDARVVFLGDYVDRGPDSAGVLDILVQGWSGGRNWVFLKGNHDRLMEYYLDIPSRSDPYLLTGYHWLHDNIGGASTLASYGVDDIEERRTYEVAMVARAAVPDPHHRFLNALKLSHRESGLFLAHAGVRPGVPLDDQVEDDLLWIRGTFHDSDADHGALVVHGHTPLKAPRHYGNRVNLDGGAGYGRPLAVAVFEGSDSWLVTDAGREPLRPE
jgi:serine/threonine protein phosphatase 1